MTASKNTASTLSLEDLDRQFNPHVQVPNRIKAALAELGDAAMTSSNFAREANVTTLQLAQVSDLFKEHLLIVRENGKQRTIWCGTTAFARKARERLGL